MRIAGQEMVAGSTPDSQQEVSNSFKVYSRSQKVGNSIASIPNKSKV